jgi:hypothetical protein
MGDDGEIERRKNLTFEQAEGLRPLPRQLARTEVSPELRAVLWNYIHQQILISAEEDIYGQVVGSPWDSILRSVHVYRDHQLVDDLSLRLKDVIKQVRLIFANGSYADMYGWLQHVMQVYPTSYRMNFAKRIADILEYARAPYRVIDNEIIYPIASEEEGDAVAKALGDLATSGMAGARGHLRAAAIELSQGHFADSVRESIHAVESVARSLEASGELSKALAQLERSAKIHGAMKAGFGSLYGYTSDSQGIRHALLDKDAPDADEADALFMIGACAAFVSYLINKGRAAGLLP